MWFLIQTGNEWNIFESAAIIVRNFIPHEEKKKTVIQTTLSFPLLGISAANSGVDTWSINGKDHEVRDGARWGHGRMQGQKRDSV